MIVLHGMTGGSSSQYIRNIVDALGKAGYRTGVLHNRGICHTPLKTTKMSHVGNSEDLGTVLQILKARNSEKKIYSVA